MRKKLTIILSVLLLVSSCTSTRRHNYILLVDNSKTISETTLNKYINIIEHTILPNLGRYDRLTIQFIDECSMTIAERIFTLNLDSMQFASKSDGMNNAADSTKVRMKRFITDSIQTILRTTLLAKREERKNCGDYTDIVNALNEATALITHEKSYTSTKDEIMNNAEGKENFEYENCIIIFSDMVNENREKTFDFTQFGKYNAQKIDAKLDDLRKINKIPDLSRCHILVYGSTSTPDAGNYANKQIENCRVFWQNFFHESGAILKGYAYDSRKEISDYMTSVN